MTSNGEHSVVDAMIYVHIREYTKYHEQYTHTYTPDGHCRGDVEVIPTAERLKWSLDDEARLKVLKFGQIWLQKYPILNFVKILKAKDFCLNLL